MENGAVFNHTHDFQSCLLLNYPHLENKRVMFKKEVNNNNVAKVGSSKHLEKPRDIEYNLPPVLIDSTRDPPRTFQRGNLLGTY